MYVPSEEGGCVCVPSEGGGPVCVPSESPKLLPGPRHRESSASADLDEDIHRTTRSLSPSPSGWPLDGPRGRGCHVCWAFRSRGTFRG